MNKYWKTKSDKFRMKYTGITDKDLEYSLGNESEMLESLGSKLGKTREEMLTILIEF